MVLLHQLFPVRQSISVVASFVLLFAIAVGILLGHVQSSVAAPAVMKKSAIKPVAIKSASPVDKSVPLESLKTTFEFGLADGPSYNEWATLYVPDVKKEKIYRYFPHTKKWDVAIPKAGRVSATYYSHGKLFLSENRTGCISYWDRKKIVQLTKLAPDAKPAVRPNDLVVDPYGGVYYTLTGRGEVMYVSPKGVMTVAVPKIKTPNGITLSPDAKTLYVAAYAPKEIWAYDLKTAGQATNGRLFATMDDGDAKGADGMTIDRAGNVYCAGASDVWIWNPAGKLLDKITPPTRPINCAFGDADRRSLYITCLGSGVYRQKMNAYGCSPSPPTEEKYQSTWKPHVSTALPETIDANLNVVYAQYGTRKMLVDIFTPKMASKLKKPLPTIVLVHGGGWKQGDKTTFRAAAIALAQKGYVTAAIEYRLCHEAKFPAAINDCHAAVRFLRANAKKYHVDINRIYAVGGSAGGHLVGLMATTWHKKDLQGDGGNAEHSAELQAAIVLAGPLEILSGSVHKRVENPKVVSSAELFFGLKNKKTGTLYEQGDAYLQISSKTCPLLFMTGEFDKPERNAPARKKLAELGIKTGIKTYSKGKHGCWNRRPWFSEMVKDMDIFYKEVN